MLSDSNSDIDTLRVIASLFWVAGSILTLVVAVKLLQLDQTNPANC